MPIVATEQGADHEVRAPVYGGTETVRPALTSVQTGLSGDRRLEGGRRAASPASVSVFGPDSTPAAVTIKAVQRELQRRGCYAGRIDGDWGPTSRFAAAMFFHAVQADVSLDEPDGVLLALSRQLADRGCNQSVGPLSHQTPTLTVQRVKVMVDGVELAGTTTKSDPQVIPRIVSTHGTFIYPGDRGVGGPLVDGSDAETTGASSVDPNTQLRNKRSSNVSAARKRSRKRWKRRVFQDVNLGGN